MWGIAQKTLRASLCIHCIRCSGMGGKVHLDRGALVDSPGTEVAE